jgi:hypothetical protein
MKSNSRSDKQFCYRQISPDTRNKGKETQLCNTTTVCLGLGGRKKHTHTTDKLFLQDRTSAGGAAAPSASTPPSAESDPASDGDTVGGSPPRRNLSAPRLGHRRRVSSRNPARADGSTGHSVASASYPPRTSARLMASATRLRRRSRQWTARPGSGR